MENDGVRSASVKTVGSIGTISERGFPATKRDREHDGAVFIRKCFGEIMGATVDVPNIRDYGVLAYQERSIALHSNNAAIRRYCYDFLRARTRPKNR